MNPIFVNIVMRFPKVLNHGVARYAVRDPYRTLYESARYDRYLSCVWLARFVKLGALRKAHLLEIIRDKKYAVLWIRLLENAFGADIRKILSNPYWLDNCLYLSSIEHVRALLKMGYITVTPEAINSAIMGKMAERSKYMADKLVTFRVFGATKECLLNSQALTYHLEDSDDPSIRLLRILRTMYGFTRGDVTFNENMYVRMAYYDELEQWGIDAWWETTYAE